MHWINQPTAAGRHVTCADPSHTTAEKAVRQSHDVPRGLLPGAHAAVPVTTAGKPGWQHWVGLLGAKAFLYTSATQWHWRGTAVHSRDGTIQNLHGSQRQHSLSITSYPTRQQLDKS